MTTTETYEKTWCSTGPRERELVQIRNGEAFVLIHGCDADELEELAAACFEAAKELRETIVVRIAD